MSWQKSDFRSLACSLLLIHPSSLLFFAVLLSHLSSLPVLFSVLCPCALVFLSQQVVLEDLRPVLTDQVQLQSSRSVQHRLESPARAEPPSTSSRPAQVVLGCGHWETLFVHLLIPAWTHWSASTHVCRLICAPSGGWHMCVLSTRLIVTNDFYFPCCFVTIKGLAQSTGTFGMVWCFAIFFPHITPWCDPLKMLRFVWYVKVASSESSRKNSVL